MTGLTINVSGVAAVKSRMERLAKDQQTKIGQAANRAGAAVAAKKIKAAAPVSNVAEGKVINRRRKDGSVRPEPHAKISNNIKVRKTRSVKTTRVQNSIDTGRAYHAHMVEFGSIHNTPQPFFRSAFDQSQQEMIDKIAQILDKRLIKAGV